MKRGIFGRILEQMLVALPPLYGLGLQARLQAYHQSFIKERRLSGLVVSIGNITAGGTGKTPMTMLIARQLLHKGYKPAILSRGYKGQLTHEPVTVDTSFWGDWKKYGDEPFLMAAKLSDIPVIVAKNRYAAGLYALQRFGRRVFLLDDGYQHIRLYRDINILLINARNPFGNGYLLPRGPLREPLSQIKRAHLVIITKVLDPARDSVQKIKDIVRRYNPLAPIFHSSIFAHNLISIDNPNGFPVAAIKEKKILAFSGVADPDSFKQLLLQAGGEIGDHLIYPDHYEYRERDFKRLGQDADNLGVKIIITTEKDFVKLRGSPYWPILKNHPIWALSMEVEILDCQPKWEEFWSSHIPDNL